MKVTAPAMPLLAFAASIASGQEPSRSAPTTIGAEEVVVEARPLATLEDDWRSCIVGGCSPRKEIARALALAEAQVGAGDYRSAWTTLRTAKRRNLRHAEDLPVPVAQLTRATARLADLNGEPVVGRIGLIDTVDTLKKGFASVDERVLVARLEIGDAFIPEGRSDAAFETYRRVAAAAEKAGLFGIAAAARYRRATLLTWLVPANPGYLPDARLAERHRSVG